MKTAIRLLPVLISFVFLCVNCLPNCGANGPPFLRVEQEDSARKFWKVFAKTVNEFDFENADRHPAIYAILEITKLCNQHGKPELAMMLWSRAEKMVLENEKRQYRQSLFSAALTFDNLNLAERVARQADRKDRLRLLDSIDLERLGRGEKDALENYPRVPLDFWKATEQGRAYVRAGDYKAADKFIQNLDIPHEENDPRTVGAFVYEEIAAQYQAQGDLKNARIWIDKAMAIGGKLFYTDYGIKTKKLAIYEEFDKELKGHAQLGVHYRGHMSRELLQGLINELIDANRLDDAKRTIKLLEREQDRDDKLIQVAGEEAIQQADIPEATLKNIQDESKKVAARIEIAAQLWLSGKKERGQDLLEKELAKLGSWHASKAFLYKKTGYAIGAMYQHDQLEKLVKAEMPSGQKAYALHQVLRGFTSAQKARNVEKRAERN